MRQVIVSQSSTLGGAERYLNRLYSKLRLDGDDPFLVGRVAGWIDVGLPQLDIGLGPKWSKATMTSGLLRVLPERRRLLSAVHGLQPDLFHLQFKREQISFTKALSRRGPVVWTEHGQFLQGTAGKLLANGYRAASRHAASIICVSEAVARDVRSVVGARTSIRVIENGVGTGASTPATESDRMAARRALGVREDLPVGLWIGRLHAAKRPELAVHTARHFNGSMIIAGDGPDKAKLDELGASVRNVTLTGHLEDPLLAYQAADALFFTSSSLAREGLPTIIAEAVSHALPVVAMDGSGLDDLFRGIGARVTDEAAGPAGWAEELSAAIAHRREHLPLLDDWARAHSERSWIAAHREAFEDATRAWSSRPDSNEGASL